MLQRKNRSGASFLEYALIASMMMIIIVAVSAAGTETGVFFDSAAEKIAEAMNAAMS